MIIMIIMDILSGMMVIKNALLKNKNKRRVNAYCLASLKMVGLMHVRRREKRDRKIVGISMYLFVFDD